MDIRHPDLSGINLVGFRDFFDESNQRLKTGSEFHGTAMTGILASNGTFWGRLASISIALALGPEGSSGQQDISLAIRWCRITKKPILSVQLGSDPAGNGYRN